MAPNPNDPNDPAAFPPVQNLTDMDASVPDSLVDWYLNPDAPSPVSESVTAPAADGLPPLPEPISMAPPPPPPPAPVAVEEFPAPPPPPPAAPVEAAAPPPFQSLPV